MEQDDARAAEDLSERVDIIVPITPPKHPAKYSATVWLTIFRDVTKIITMHPEKTEWHVLDPFGGVGGIFDLHDIYQYHAMKDVKLHITSVEIEHEWAEVGQQHPKRQPHDRSLAMDFFDFAEHPSAQEAFDLVITSPTYGNRMADHHTPSPEDTSERNTYRHKLGRPLTEGSSAMLQWGDDYRDFHRAAWGEVWDLLEPGGYFILNIKDHIRKGAKQPVAAWHRAYCSSIGFNKIMESRSAVRGNRQGENHEARVEHEHVYVFQKPFQVSVDSMGEAQYAEQSLLKGERG